MKYYLIAGEASGDLHASNLMKELAQADRNADFRFFGGDLMASVGGRLVKHYREMAFMGIWPVLTHLPTILRNLSICKEDIKQYAPDFVILIDYPGFNLKIAKYVKTCLKNIPVCYYISPKIWAWKKYRIKSFKRYVDRMFCILPFEKEFYANLNYSVDYVGNPTVDAVEDYINNHPLPVADNDGFPVLALLAGSRRQEIKDNLPMMIAVAECFPYLKAVIAGAPGIEREYYDSFIAGKKVDILYDSTYALLRQSKVALVTSGTATLETCLFRVPQAVCYRTPLAPIVGFIFRHFFHTKYISLVNLIAGREVVRELFADSLSKDLLEGELHNIIYDDEYLGDILDGYEEVIAALGQSGASARTAQLIIGMAHTS